MNEMNDEVNDLNEDDKSIGSDKSIDSEEESISKAEERTDCEDTTVEERTDCEDTTVEEKRTGDKIFYQTVITTPKNIGNKKIKKLLKKINSPELKVWKQLDKSKKYKIFVTSENKTKVQEAKMYITKVLFSVKNKISMTHLITIPFNKTKLQNEFLKFKSDVLNLFGNERGIDEDIFQNPEKLHSTFTILVLPNEEEINKATELFNKCHEKIVKPLIENEEINFEIRGVNTFQPSHEKTQVLFANFEHPRLQNIADQIVQRFAQHGLITDDKNLNVKLHITLMNSLFRSRKKHDKDKKTKRKKRESFDATKIIQYYNNHLFCDWTLNNIQLNDALKKDHDGFYKVISQMKWDH